MPQGIGLSTFRRESLILFVKTAGKETNEKMNKLREYFFLSFKEKNAGSEVYSVNAEAYVGLALKLAFNLNISRKKVLTNSLFSLSLSQLHFSCYRSSFRPNSIVK